MADGTPMLLEVEEYIDDRPLPLSVPLSNYWAMDEGYFFTSLNALLALSPSDASAMAEAGNARMQEEADSYRSGERKPYRLQDGVAYIDMVGPMTKRPNCMAEMFGGGGVSTVRMRQALRAAIKDDAVKSVMIVMESPGGEVNGAFDLAKDVQAANKIKPVAAYIEDLGASAAYLVASQAGTIFANANAVTGSIGVYQELHDTSKAHAFRGIKVHIVKAGDQKAIGAPGTEITEEQIAVVQKNANKLHGLFLRAVSIGRGMDAKALSRVADGGIFIGTDGKRAGLLDHIVTLDQAHSDITNQKRRKMTKGKTHMAADTEQVQQMLDAAADDEMPELDEDRTTVALEPITPPSALLVPASQAAATIDSTMAAALAGFGITTVAQLEAIREQAKIGEDYRAALAKQVTSLAVVAFGQTDGPLMASGVDNMPVPQLRALNRQFATIAESKGLLSANGARGVRETSAQEIAGSVLPTTGASSESNEGRVQPPKTEKVAENRQNLQATGLYGF